MSERFPDVDWYCDRCNAHLNSQFGFDDNKYTWKCEACGHKNSISRDNIYESQDAMPNEPDPERDSDESNIICVGCGFPLKRSSVLTPKWADGDNPYAYVTCADCGAGNIME